MAYAIRGVVVGIDLGTTNSCVSMFRNGIVKVISDQKNGSRVIPSVVVFTDKGYIVGKEAKDMSPVDKCTCVYETKRLLGRQFDDPLVQADIKRWPFDVVNNDGKPFIRVVQNNKVTLHSPEKISSLILHKMKSIAEEYLKDLDIHEPVTQAVITVPAYFNDSQRQATKTAAKLAGLEVRRMINEPTAAAIAYGFKTKVKEEENILVFDLGGGTFDVSIISIEDGIFQVLATGGDTHLGGADFDNAVADKILDHFHDLFNINPPITAEQRKQLGKRLIRHVEFAKCEVSTDSKFFLKIDEFYDKKDLEFTLKREDFESINDALFSETIEHVAKVMKDAEVTPENIDHVVLVGGSTRIPIIQTKLKEFFKTKKLNKSINPEEAVAHGAALMGAILTEQKGVDDILLMDVTPLTLGVDLKGGIMKNIIARNTLIPARGTGGVTTVEDNQERINWNIYQGERSIAKENHYLGRLVLDGIEPAPAGVPSVEVIFDLDSDGILTVSARNKKTGDQRSVKITHNKAYMSERDATEALRDAEKHLQEDTTERDRIVSRNKLEAFVQWILYLVREPTYNVVILSNYRADILNRCEETLKWLQLNEHAGAEEFAEQHRITSEVCQDLPADYLVPGQLPQRSKVKRRLKPSWSSAAQRQQCWVSDDEENVGDLD